MTTCPFITEHLAWQPYPRARLQLRRASGNFLFEKPCFSVEKQQFWIQKLVFETFWETAYTFHIPPIIRKCKKKKQQNYFWALVIGQCSEIMLLLFFALKKKETLFKFSTASKGVKISRHLFWSTVLQNKCLDIFLPRYPVLHINKVTFFIADALEKCGSDYFGALTIDQCSKIIIYMKFSLGETI